MSNAMICKYEVKDGVLFQTYPDVMKGNDIFSLSNELDLVEKKHPIVTNVVADLREITTFDAKFESILEFTKLRGTKEFPNPFKTAILVSNNYQMGFARMFQTLNDNPQITVEIFTDEAKALEWIKSTTTSLNSHTEIKGTASKLIQ